MFLFIKKREERTDAQNTQQDVLRNTTVWMLVSEEGAYVSQQDPGKKSEVSGGESLENDG